jgi:GntR family transcriptional regulator/MocR family aminotransferase
MWLELDGDGALHQQTYRALRQAILAGRLRAGERLPATRALARELRVSRNTLLQAYEQLADEGYVSARTGSGTFVAKSLPDEAIGPAGPPSRAAPARRAAGAPGLRLSDHARRSLAAAPRGQLSWALPRKHLPYDFRYGEPAYGDLPLDTWCRLLGRRARRASVSRLAYGDPGGAPELRRALAGYLRRARGVACAPEQILLTHGSQQAIDLCFRVLVDPGDRVAIEEPHYSGISIALAAQGGREVPIAVDENGLRVELLEEAADVRGVCVTPSHQFPAGGILSLERRLALLAWARRENAFVLEDDYDGEYRYEGRPVPCLQGLDAAGRVVYVGTASKLLFPSLRIGWLVVPEPLVRPFALAKACADTGSATLEQAALADFIEGGHLERHVRRSRLRNAARCEAFRTAVQRHLAGAALLSGTRAGVHGLLWIPDLPAAREAELRRAAEARGVGIYPIRPYYTRPPRRAGFLLGYAALSEGEIDEGIRRLAAALAEL